MYYIKYNGAQCYEHFVQIGRLDRTLILLGLALHLPIASVTSVFMGCIYLNFLLHSLDLLYPSVALAWWEWPLTYLTNHCPSSDS